jgi:hypothetical protein
VGCLLLAADKSVGIGGAFKIPFTDVSVKIMGAIGVGSKLEQTFPAYGTGRSGLNTRPGDILNHNQAMIIGPIGAEDIVSLGIDKEAPGFDLILNIK